MTTRKAARRLAQKRRDLAAELAAGFAALAEERRGQLTLPTHAVESEPAPRIPRTRSKTRTGRPTR